VKVRLTLVKDLVLAGSSGSLIYVSLYSAGRLMKELLAFFCAGILLGVSNRISISFFISFS
jgi:hypothetical protein